MFNHEELFQNLSIKFKKTTNNKNNKTKLFRFDLAENLYDIGSIME